MELLVIFAIISAIDKIFKSKKDQKNIQEARKKRMESDLNQTQSKPQSQVQTRMQKPKSLTEKIKEEIEKGYRELEKGYKDLEKNMEMTKPRNMANRPNEGKTEDLREDKRYISDYTEPYEVINGRDTLEGKAYQGDRYFSEYEKPYETHGRKTGSQEGKTYRKLDDKFYNRREKETTVLGKEGSMSMRSQVLTGIIYSEILGKPKSQQNRGRSI